MTSHTKQAALNPVMRGVETGTKLKQMMDMLSNSGIGLVARGALGGLAGALFEEDPEKRYMAAAGGALMGVAAPHAVRGLVQMVKEPNSHDIMGVGLGATTGALTQEDSRRLGGAAFGTTMGLALKGLMKRGSDEAYYEKQAGWEQAVHRFAGAKPFQVIGKGIQHAEKAIGAGGDLGTVARVGVGAGLGYATADKDSDTSSKMIRTGLGGLGGLIAPSIVGDVGRVGKNVTSLVANPVKHLREGWRGHSPTGMLRAGKTPTEVQSRMQAATKGGYEHSLAAQQKPGFLSRLWHGGEEQAIKARTARVKSKYQHLVDQQGNVRNAGQWRPDEGRNVVQGVGDELSRRGWTGSGTGDYLGGATKYLPVGPKGIATLLGASAVPAVYDAARGEGTWSDAAGNIGSALMYAGAPVTAGMGMAGSMGLAHLGGLAAAPVGAVENMVRGRPVGDMSAVKFKHTNMQNLAQAANASYQANLGVDHGLGR